MLGRRSNQTPPASSQKSYNFSQCDRSSVFVMCSLNAQLPVLIFLQIINAMSMLWITCLKDIIQVDGTDITLKGKPCL